MAGRGSRSSGAVEQHGNHRARSSPYPSRQFKHLVAGRSIGEGQPWISAVLPPDNLSECITTGARRTDGTWRYLTHAEARSTGAAPVLGRKDDRSTIDAPVSHARARGADRGRVGL